MHSQDTFHFLTLEELWGSCQMDSASLQIHFELHEKLTSPVQTVQLPYIIVGHDYGCSSEYGEKF